MTSTSDDECDDSCDRKYGVCGENGVKKAVSCIKFKVVQVV